MKIYGRENMIKKKRRKNIKNKNRQATVARPSGASNLWPPVPKRTSNPIHPSYNWFFPRLVGVCYSKFTIPCTRPTWSSRRDPRRDTRLGFLSIGIPRTINDTTCNKNALDMPKTLSRYRVALFGTFELLSKSLFHKGVAGIECLKAFEPSLSVVIHTYICRSDHTSKTRRLREFNVCKLKWIGSGLRSECIYRYIRMYVLYIYMSNLL